MTIALDVYPAWVEKISAAVHVDNTARPQWISSEYNPSAYRILASFYEKTGIPALINTSFNSYEEPIVCNPTEAVFAWRKGYADVLAIGNILLI